MSQLGFPLLSVIVYLPLVGAAVVLALDGRNLAAVKATAFLFSSLTFLASLPLYFFFQTDTAAMQFVEKVPWIESLGINYQMGIDGISLWLVLLTTFLSTIAILSSWSAITTRVKGYYAVMLVLETGMIGVFVATDLFLFYVFWEAMLIPMYFLIGIWGGPSRIYAAVKFFLYTMAGGVLMLVGILALYFFNHAVTGLYTFDLLELRKLNLDFWAQLWLFLAFSVAFAIKVPMFPFHTWLPDAHVEAPTAGSVILAGVLLKMGTYGFVRFSLPLFPAAARELSAIIAALAIIGIIYGALVSLIREDVKKLVAYSSVSHLGFVMLGLFAFNSQGVQGGILQMINHGLSTGALFLIVGMLYERRHTRMIADFGGLWKVIPLFSMALLVVSLASIGLPGLNGFVGEFLILVGAFRHDWLWAALGATGVILSAVYMLWMLQRMIFGELKKQQTQVLRDLSAREVLVLAPIIVLIFLIGVYPWTFLKPMEASTQALLAEVKSKGQVLVLDGMQAEGIPMARQDLYR